MRDVLLSISIRALGMWAAILVALLGPLTSTMVYARSQDTNTAAADDLAPRFDQDQRLYDNANLLTDDQDQSFESDLARASGLGIEMVVYTRISTDDEQASQAFADQIRTAWQVESLPGADDGIVILLTYDPSDLENHSVVVSEGEHAFPIRQLTSDGYQEILVNEMRPELLKGNFDFALMYGIRRVLNYAEYSPPNPEALTDRQLSIGNLARIAAAVTLQAAILGYVVAGVVSRRRLTLRPTPRSLGWYGLLLAGMAILSGILGIAGRDRTSSLIALVVFVWSCLGVPLLVAALSRTRRTGTTVPPTRSVPAASRRRTAKNAVEATAHG